MTERRVRWRRPGAALGIVILASMLGVSPVSAGAEHTGTYGAHVLVDTDAYPGVTCNYPDPSNNTLRDIRIRAPIVYAVNRTSTRDSQMVGWKYLIYRTTKPDHNTYALAYKSAPMKATAYDDYNAQWSGVRYTIPNPAEFHRYLVRIRMIWYWPSTTQPDGTALHAPTRYRYLVNGTPSGNVNECGHTKG